MAMLTKTLAAFGLVVTTFSASAVADTYQHIDQLALSIFRQSKQIVTESRHYRHTPEYKHLVTDALKLSRLANHIHELAHHHGSLAHLESDLETLDLEFHHLESVFDRIEHRAAHGHGHVHGNTSHVKRLLDLIEANIHHLQEDLLSMRPPVHRVRPVVVQRPTIHTTPHSNDWGRFNSRRHGSGFGHGGGMTHGGGWAYGRDHYRYDDHGSRGRGITIGGGSSRFTFRF